jgi:hypothetical protein
MVMETAAAGKPTFGTTKRRRDIWFVRLKLTVAQTRYLSALNHAKIPGAMRDFPAPHYKKCDKISIYRYNALMVKKEIH